MLQVNKASGDRDGTVSQEGSSLADTYNTVLGIVRRQLPVFLILVSIFIFLGLLYLFTTPSSYTATATMVIDTHKVQVFQQQSVLGDAPIDAGTVQTEVEILKSNNISLAVIKSLHLTDDPEFVSNGSGLLGTIVRTITGLLSQSDARSEAQLEQKALAVFESNRAISRVGLTYVMSIDFTSHDPAKAAQIANAISDAYINDQLEAKYQATRRASVWLQDRIKELRTQATAADRAVVNFKQAHNINTVDTNGTLLSEQDLGQVNSELILANAATAEAKARLDRINDIMKEAIPDASVADALKSEVIIKLRQDYLALAGREAIWSSKYGPNHLAAVSLRNQMQELRRNISDEMKKIAQSYQSDYEIATAREEALKSSLAKSVSQSQLTNQAQIQLRELESNSQSYRSMYDNFLQRYMEAVQQQSFPITEARLISPASPPSHRSQPKTLIVLAITILGGVMVSFGVASVREMADRVFRTTGQIESALDANCLSMLPAVKQAPVSAALVDAHIGARQISGTSSMLRYVVDAPFSQFTEALRSVKVAADLSGASRANRVIGVTSTLPNEGKSTISANFAQLISHAGGRVLLVDADLRNPSLSRGMAPKAEGGLVDVLAGRKTLEEVLWTDSASGLSFLPVGGSSKLMHTNEILSSPGVRQLFGKLREAYDYVIVDFAPLAPVVDTRTTTSFIDSYIYVIEWGRTRVDVVKHTLGDAPEIHDRLLGIVMNKADMNTLGRYEHYRGKYYYNKYYARYGYTA